MNAPYQPAVIDDVQTEASEHWMTLRALSARLERAAENAPAAEPGKWPKWKDDLAVAVSLALAAELEAAALLDRLENISADQVATASGA